MTALKLVNPPLNEPTPLQAMALAADQSMADALRGILSQLGDEAVPVLVGELQSLIHELQSMRTPALLLVDFGEEQDVLTAASRLAEVCDPGVRVIALGTVNDLRVRDRLISAGVSDYLLRTSEIETIRDAVCRQLTPAAAEVIPSASEDPDDVAMVIGLMGVSGGVGTSTIAANLAFNDATVSAENCVLVDLDLVFGTQAVHFDVDPGGGLVDAMTAPERLDDLFAKRVMVRITENFRVIAAEADLEKRHVVNAAAFSQLIDHVAPQAKRIYVDFPKHLIIEDPKYLNCIDTLVLVAAPSLVALRDSGRLMRWFRELMPEMEVQVILNRRDKASKQDLDHKTFSEHLPKAVLAEIPADPNAVSQAEAEGKCAVQSARKSKFALAVARAGSALLPDTNHAKKNTGLPGLLKNWRQRTERKNE